MVEDINTNVTLQEDEKKSVDNESSMQLPMVDLTIDTPTDFSPILEDLPIPLPSSVQASVPASVPEVVPEVVEVNVCIRAVSEADPVIEAGDYVVVENHRHLRGSRAINKANAIGRPRGASRIDGAVHN